jgi:serine protease
MTSAGRGRRRWFGAALGLVVLGAAAPAGADPPRHLLALPLPNDPLLAQQWDLLAAGADAFPLLVAPDTAFRPVLVAVIDAGIDPTNPDLAPSGGAAGVVAVRQGFVPGQGLVASLHGTLIAGIVGARTNNGVAIASIAPAVRILDLQVADATGTIQPPAEAAAIHYAISHGARIISISFGAVRDPGQPDDGYSPIEAQAVRDAVAHGLLVVAAGGNSAGRLVDWPAGLWHVLGVGSVDQTRTVSSFSNHDPQRLDLAAPGEGIVSLVPVSLAASGVSVDAPGAEGIVAADGTVAGTSFAAPHVAAAAALLFSLHQDWSAAQVASLLETSARRLVAARHDNRSGFGEVSVAAALSAAAVAAPSVPQAYEPNDDAGSQAPILRFSTTLHLRGTCSVYDDPLDVFRIAVAPGTRLIATLRAAATLEMMSYAPGTTRIAALGSVRAQHAALHAVAGPAATKRLVVVSRRRGYFYLAVWAQSGVSSYDLSLRRSP